MIKTRLNLIEDKCTSSHCYTISKDKRIKKEQEKINLIEEEMSNSSSNSNVPQDKQEQDKKMKLQKRILSSAETCARKFLTDDGNEGSMVKYCSKKNAKVMETKRAPNSDGYKSILSVVNTFDKIFYSNEEPEAEILQFDGNSDLFDEDKEVPNLYGVSCEIDTLTVWINFLRGLQTLWEVSNQHGLCEFYPKQESCFFLPNEKFVLTFEQ